MENSFQLLDQKEMEMVNLVTQMEFVLIQMIIFLFVIISIIEFKYSIQMENTLHNLM